MKYVGALGNRSLSDNGSYTDACNDAVYEQDAFDVFKRDPRYTRILEHVSEELGSKYLEIVRQQSPALIERYEMFKINDLLGNPVICTYPMVGDTSPSTLRYVKVLSDIVEIFGDVKYDKVAEIGAGYGGQVLINDQIMKVSEYHLFDLPPVLSLISKYLESHLLNGSYKTYTINQHNGGVDYDLVISNYAFSELPLSIQEKYISKILTKSRRGYLTMNSGKKDSPFQGEFMTLERMKELLPEIKVYSENPENAAGNYVIVWGNE
jgi:hypothetical protein